MKRVHAAIVELCLLLKFDSWADSLPVAKCCGVVWYPEVGASIIRVSAKVSSVWERLTASIMASVIKPGYCGDSAWAFVVLLVCFARCITFTQVAIHA